VWGKGCAYSGMNPAPVRCGKGRELPALGVEGSGRGGVKRELTHECSYESWTSIYEGLAGKVFLRDGGRNMGATQVQVAERMK